MKAKPLNYDRTRKTHTVFLTLVAGLCSVGLVVALILFCYQSSHLHI